MPSDKGNAMNPHPEMIRVEAVSKTFTLHNQGGAACRCSAM